MGAGDGNILCLLPTIRDRKLYSHASQISAESGTCSAQFGQFFCGGMRWLAKNRSPTKLFVSVLSATEDLKKLPYFFFAIRAIRKTRINPIAENCSIFKSAVIMSVLPSVITSFTKLESCSIVISYIGFTDYLM
jgi:hypothetical protein